MPSIRNTPEFKSKLDEIRTKLMGNPSKAELEAMQLHISALDKLAQISADEPYHNHDQNDHHDHTIVMDVAQQAIRNRAP
jgi:hypothetical protein